MMSDDVITVFGFRGSQPGHGACSVIRNRLTDSGHHALADADASERLVTTSLQQQPPKPPGPGKPPVKPPGPDKPPVEPPEPGKPPVEPPEPGEPPVQPPGPGKPPVEPPGDAPVYIPPRNQDLK